MFLAETQTRGMRAPLGSSTVPVSALVDCWAATRNDANPSTSNATASVISTAWIAARGTPLLRGIEDGTHA
jgi:hypothetical protein